MKEDTMKLLIRLPKPAVDWLAILSEETRHETVNDYVSELVLEDLASIWQEESAMANIVVRLMVATGLYEHVKDCDLAPSFKHAYEVLSEVHTPRTLAVNFGYMLGLMDEEPPKKQIEVTETVYSDLQKFAKLKGMSISECVSALVDAAEELEKSKAKSLPDELKPN